eukprot:GHVR01048274.1.p1 GENE.GHVR01048274.1~~GHVR01048274.1.p1  ORF type:complete len:298 (+),score=44.23 GHVR01048274.1:313-1206(+)
MKKSRFSIVTDASISLAGRRMSVCDSEGQAVASLHDDEWLCVFSFFDLNELLYTFRPVCSQLRLLVNVGVAAVRVSSRTVYAVNICEFKMLQLLTLSQLNQRGFRIICAQLDQCRHLTKLTIEFCRIEANTAERLSCCLACLPSLVELHIDSCRVSEAAVRSLCVGLPSIHTLRGLSLADNELCPSVLSLFVEVLPLCNRLEVLDLDCNNLTDSGASVLAKHVRVCSSLVALALSGNFITDVGASAIAEISRRLTSLDLSDNSGITDQTVTAFEKFVFVGKCDCVCVCVCVLHSRIP